MGTTARRERDELIALRCRLGEPAAFAELVRELERPLLYYATKLLGDEDRAFDVLQEVWLTAFRTVGRLEEPGALRAWLYRIAHGLVVDRIRQDVSHQRVEAARAEAVPEAGPEPSFDAADAAAVHRALDALDARHREVLVLHFLEDMPLGDIASVLGCPEGTVKSRIFHAKRALKEILERGGYGHE
jgi:RNA polymerase sigma-70 factor (ECF subfamily)